MRAALAGVAMAALAAAFSAAASSAVASPAFDAFRTVCGDTGANLDAVRAATVVGHWTSTEVTASTMQGVDVQESLARALTVGNAHLTVFAWRGVKGKIAVAACTVRVVSGAKFGDLARDSRAWVGFDPQSATDAKSAWQMSDAAGHRAPVAKDAYDAAAAGPGLEFFTVTADGPETILDLLKIKS